MNKPIQEWLDEAPPEDYIKSVPGEGLALHIPIEFCENLLDAGTDYSWGTQKYQQALYQDDQGLLCAYGSIEVIVNSPFGNMDRILTGAANINLQELKERQITDWAASLKSMCIKNALTDWGKKTGRGLNTLINQPISPAPERPRSKPKADPDIRSKFAKFAAEGNLDSCLKLEETYDFT